MAILNSQNAKNPANLHDMSNTLHAWFLFHTARCRCMQKTQPPPRSLKLNPVWSKYLFTSLMYQIYEWFSGSCLVCKIIWKNWLTIRSSSASWTVQSACEGPFAAEVLYRRRRHVQTLFVTASLLWSAKPLTGPPHSWIGRISPAFQPETRQTCEVTRIQQKE